MYTNYRRTTLDVNSSSISIELISVFFYLLNLYILEKKNFHFTFKLKKTLNNENPLIFAKKVRKMPRKGISEARRYQIVGLSLDKTKSNYEIARLVGVSEKCVRTTLKNNKELGSPLERPRIGRPSKLFYYYVKCIIRAVRVSPKIRNQNLASKYSQKF